MGASRARHVKGSRRRQGSMCFRSNDGSYSVRAVFGLPPRSDRGSRRADAVAIPTALSAREDLTVIAPFRSKEYRRMPRQQGGIGRYAGLAGSRTERGDQAQIPGSSSRERCSSSEVLPSARAAGQNFFTDRLPSHRATGRSHRVPEATQSLASARLLRQRHGEPVLRPRRESPRRPEPSGTGRHGSVFGRQRCCATRTALKSAERPADEPSGQV
jgi:hypothetical protein